MPLKRRSPLRAKTPLRRHTPLRNVRPATRRRNGSLDGNVPAGIREEVYLRDHNVCAVCEGHILPWDYQQHHIAYRSHVAPAIRHQAWNLASVHDSIVTKAWQCHGAAHKSRKIRELLEKIAMQRLMEFALKLDLGYWSEKLASQDWNFRRLLAAYEDWYIRKYGKRA